MKTTNRAVPNVVPKVSRVVKPMVSPPRNKLPGSVVRRRMNARKVGVIINKNSVKFTNTSNRGKACDSFKKDEVVEKAKKMGLEVDSKMSKKEICELIKKRLT